MSAGTAQAELPIQPVDKPILCSPYKEPDQHWLYNRSTGIPRQEPGDNRYPRRALIVCPNLTIRERLAVLNPGDPDNYFDKFDLVPSALRPELTKGRLRVTNWHAFNPETEDIRVGGVAVARLGPETADSFARSRLSELWDDEPILVFNDEGHHAYRPAPVP